jgi:hypothetical protein
LDYFFHSRNRIDFGRKNGGNEPIWDTIHTLKCHNETLCIDILNMQKCLFFLKKWRTQMYISSCLGAGKSGRGEDIRKGCRRMNMVEIICTHVRKWKNETC